MTTVHAALCLALCVCVCYSVSVFLVSRCSVTNLKLKCLLALKLQENADVSRRIKSLKSGLKVKRHIDGRSVFHSHTVRLDISPNAFHSLSC